MRRDDATRLLREMLDSHNLKHWHILLVNDIRNKTLLGKCDYKNQRIMINIHHLDIHPDIEIKDTFLHEIAHALTPGNGHNDIWKAKAKELGALPQSVCSMDLDPQAVEAIRSG